MTLSKNSVEGKAEAFLQRIERLNGELDSLRGKYMNDAKSIREDIKEIFTEAKDAGVPTRALRGLVKYRELERKQQALADGLDIDESAAFEQLVKALGDFGDTPLGNAAIKAAANGDDHDVRPNFLKQQEAERADEEHLAKVGRGKKPSASDAVDSLANP